MIRNAFIALALLARLATQGATAEPVNATRYSTVKVDGLSIFYREAGPANAPTILFLHGFPSSSRMYEPLFERLSAHYHLVAPDYPGFGHSDAPSAQDFSYTFDHLASITEKFTEAVGLNHYVLYVQDYGGPVGMRLAIAHPERLQGLIVQNTATHDEGLGPLWEKRKAFWRDREQYEKELRRVFFSLETTRQRHIGTNPHPETIDPDRWTDEYRFLSSPGEADIQTDLFYSYQTNVASYPAWDKWLREHQPPSLVVWGRYDPSFQVDEVAAFKRDVPQAETHILDAGHFAIYDKPDEIAAYVANFMSKLNLSDTP